MTTAHMHRDRTDRGEHGSGLMLRSGWITFAAIMMMFGGAMAILQGAAALAKDDVFVVTNNYAYTFSLTSWGWTHLILGILVVLAGAALIRGALWARVVGVFLAGLSMIANFLWLPQYPFWAIVLITINAFVIWALCTGPSRETRA